MNAKTVLKLAPFSAILALIAACGPGPVVPSTPTLTLDATPAEIELWETSEISWTATDADELSLLVDGVEVWAGSDAAGSFTYDPDQPGTVEIMLVGNNEDGSAEERVSVVVKEIPPDFAEPLGFEVDLEGGNSDHTSFMARLSFDLVGTELEISGEIPYVDVVPSRATIREGSFWAHFISPGAEVASYPLSGEIDEPVDLGASLSLTWEQVFKLRNGQYYLEVDTDKTALGPILASDELLAAGGQIEVHLSGLPPATAVMIRFPFDVRVVDTGPIEFLEVPGAVIGDLYYGEYDVVAETYVEESMEYVPVVTPETVTVGLGLLPEVSIVYPEVP